MRQLLDEVGVKASAQATIYRSLARAVQREYRDQVSAACYAHAAPTGHLAAVLYDLTTLHFETPKEDALRGRGVASPTLQRQIRCAHGPGLAGPVAVAMRPSFHPRPRGCSGTLPDRRRCGVPTRGPLVVLSRAGALAGARRREGSRRDPTTRGV